MPNDTTANRSRLLCARSGRVIVLTANQTGERPCLSIGFEDRGANNLPYATTAERDQAMTGRIASLQDNGWIRTS